MMPARSIGILHPGAMGAALAASAKNSGCEVYWVSEGRSLRTRERAQGAGLADAGTLAALCGTVPIIASVCPPEFAEATCAQVAAAGFRGTYLDANALSPERKQRMALTMEASGVRFVDGGIIGLPGTPKGETWLYLSGAAAAGAAASEVAEHFTAGPIAAEVIGGEIGRASALKMCFAAHNKGSTALFSAVFAAARHYGVLDDLKRQWTRRGPSLPVVEREIARAAPKAWRFVHEMREIAATLESAGLPPGFHQAAAEVYERLREFKDAEGVSVEDVLRRIQGKG